MKKEEQNKVNKVSKGHDGSLNEDTVGFWRRKVFNNAMPWVTTRRHWTSTLLPW